jgi:hypothetical protein
MTVRAGKTCLPVDDVQILELPSLGVSVNVVSKRRSASVDRCREDRLDLPNEPSETLVRKSVEGLGRMDTRSEERLVGVDVPNPGEHRLVEEGRLGLSTKPAERLLKLGSSRQERVRAEIPPGVSQTLAGWEESQTAKSPGVAEEKLGLAAIAAPKTPAGVAMAIGSRQIGSNGHAARHSQMDAENAAVCCANSQVLAAAEEFRDASADKKSLIDRAIRRSK